MPSANCFFDKVSSSSASEKSCVQWGQVHRRLYPIIDLFVVTDKRSSSLPDCLVPLAVSVAVLGIAVAFGMQTGMLHLCLYPLLNVERLTALW